MRTNAFVVGWPVAHSRSPLVHRFWLKRYSIDGDYRREAIPPDELPSFLGSLAARGYVGGNVTIPHKEAAFRACVETTAVARRLEAVNTLWLQGGSLCGDNTDAYGFAANLDEHAPAWRTGSTALVIGAGGAARAVVHALVAAGFGSIGVLNRTAERARALARHFGPPVQAGGLDAMPSWLAAADLVVNATSAEMTPHSGLAIDWSVARSGAVATDIVYVPLATPFLQGARCRGLVTVDGLGMLLYQAVPGFERWFGVRPEVDAELRAHVLADIEG
jgi:shikimate dehydrogenase